MYKVLVISCHPDDMEISCAGTLLKCKARGDEITVCHVANGNMGHVVIQPDELRRIRIEEARVSSESHGFNIMTCDIGDLTVNSADREQQDKIVEVIRKVDPDFIITHGPDDYMIDHVEVSKLVFFASFSASVPHYREDLGPASKVTPIYYMENSGFFGDPEEFVDISDYIDQKLEMLAEHKSQIVWLMDHDSNDVLESTRICSRFRGLQCGAKYAEGFRSCRVHLRATTKRYLP